MVGGICVSVKRLKDQKSYFIRVYLRGEDREEEFIWYRDGSARVPAVFEFLVLRVQESPPGKRRVIRGMQISVPKRGPNLWKAIHGARKARQINLAWPGWRDALSATLEADEGNAIPFPKLQEGLKALKELMKLRGVESTDLASIENNEHKIRRYFQEPEHVFAALEECVNQTQALKNQMREIARENPDSPKVETKQVAPDFKPDSPVGF